MIDAGPARTHRRALLAGGAAAVLLGSTVEAADDLAALEARGGGRLGVCAIDTGTGRRLAHHADERFAMCSTFKALLAGAVLARVDRGEERLDRRIPYTAADMVSHAPVTHVHLAEGAMDVESLCKAVVEVSDNPAANLLLKTLGGPEGLTAYARALDDATTRLDRFEIDLNTALPGDPRDTTSPAAMAGTLRKLVLGEALSAASRRKLTDWMAASTTGLRRLRQTLPQGWRAADKTGTGGQGSTNDIAVFWPPSGAPILVAAYLTETTAPLDVREGVLADVGALAVKTFATGAA